MVSYYFNDIDEKATGNIGLRLQRESRQAAKFLQKDAYFIHSLLYFQKQDI